MCRFVHWFWERQHDANPHMKTTDTIECAKLSIWYLLYGNEFIHFHTFLTQHITTEEPAKCFDRVLYPLHQSFQTKLELWYDWSLASIVTIWHPRESTIFRRGLPALELGGMESHNAKRICITKLGSAWQATKPAWECAVASRKDHLSKHAKSHNCAEIHCLANARCVLSILNLDWSLSGTS